MKRIHTAAELREIDAHAARELKVPTALLMESAGRAVADHLAEVDSRARIAVACGKGNNGGDGWVAARHLFARGHDVFVVSLAKTAELKGDARAAAEAAIACGVPVAESIGDATVIVDALFGTGLTRPLDGDALALVDAINRSGSRVVAVDLPSGLDADRHHAIGAHVWATETIALHALKPALVQYPSREACGQVLLANLGIPSSFAPGPARRFLDDCPVAIPRRAADAHKGTSGHLLVLAGAPGKSGASALACRAAFRSGAGLVTLASSREVLDQVIAGTPEIMGFPVEQLDGGTLLAALDRKSAFVVGPGLARTAHTGELLVELLSHVAIPSVLDADALNALADDRAALSHLRGARVPPILTPHPAELARLLDVETKEIQADRFAAATRAAREFGAHVVLKGACTVIAHPDGSIDVNATGTPAMATAGTGDVLAGIAGALLAQGMSPLETSQLAPWLHGRAGEIAAGWSDRGLLANDLIDRLPELFRSGSR